MLYKVVFNNAEHDDEFYKTKKDAESSTHKHSGNVGVEEVESKPCNRCNGSGTEYYMLLTGGRGIPDPSHDICSICDGLGEVEDDMDGGEDDNSVGPYEGAL